MLVREAVAAYSPTYREGPAAAVFERAARARGLRVTHQDVDAGRHNLIISLGSEPPTVLFVGHMDTVAGTGQVRTSLDNDCLYGLGTCDMKGACAAMLLALSSLKDQVNDDGPGVALALVVGEEEYGDGVEVLCREYAVPDLVVIGEPSSLRPCLSHYGYFEARLVFEGVTAHSAVPEAGVNAIDAVLQWTQAIRERSAQIPGLRMVVRQISGGSNQFVVPHRCECVVDIHMPPDMTVHEVDALIDAARPGGYEQVRFRRSHDYATRGYRVEPDTPEVAMLQHAFERTGIAWQPSVFPSHSDATVLAKHARAAIVCGPGALAHAHAPDEHVPVAELLASCELYRNIALQAVGRSGEKED